MARLAKVSREPSVASSSSAGSCIVLDAGPAIDTPATTPEPERVARVRDTPPVTIETAVVAHRRRSTRITVVKTPKTQSISGWSAPALTAALKYPQSRTVSGETLVEGIERPEKELLNQGIEALDIGWNVGELSAAASAQAPAEKIEVINRRKSSRVGGLARAASLMANKVSVLGKRGREAIESGKEKLQHAFGGEQKRSLRSHGSESKLSQDTQEPIQKKVKTDAAPATKAIVSSPVLVTSQPLPKKNKIWLTSGLYVGQEQDFDARLTDAQNKRKRLSKSGKPTPKRNSVLPLPMFRGHTLLELGRPFQLPFDVFSPHLHERGQPRAEWNKTQSNKFMGEAATEWKKHKPLPSSRCLCTPATGCDEDCQNRVMYYECDDSNCNLGTAACGNRQFADLKQRCRKQGTYNIGHDIVPTGRKGFGVRACRTFEPNQIIMEYAGEIITQDECESRMRTTYRHNKDFYLMTFDQNMIIDATACGSSARFVNHSCEPNCKMEKWTVAGKPRMALFAGDNGIMTGDELTYDYNFDNFSQSSKQQCHCGTPSCRGFLGPRTTSAERDTSQKPQENTGVLAGAKRKLGQLLAPNHKVARTSSVLKKKRRATVAFVSAAPRVITPKRVTSASTSRSTLVEKDAQPPKRGYKIPTSLQSSPASSKRGIVKKTPVKTKNRRHTFDALARAASNAKNHLSSSLRSSTTLLRSSSRLKLAGGEGTNEGGESTAAGTTTARDEDVKPATASPDKGAASAVKRDIVSSVKGPRHAAAMKKYGMKANRGGNASSKSMRLIFGSDEES